MGNQKYKIRNSKPVRENRNTFIPVGIGQLAEEGQGSMKNTYCLFQIKFITEYTNVQHVIITQID